MNFNISLGSFILNGVANCGHIQKILTDDINPKLAIMVAYLLQVSKHLNMGHLQYNSIVAGMTVY